MIAELREILQKNIFSDELLHSSVRSIYGIGGIAKNKENISDIDLNFFLNDNSSAVLDRINDLQYKIFQKTGKKVDVNIVDMASFENNMANSDLFPLKYRHALFLYELKIVKCLLYGEDILEAVQFHYADLISECLKLCFTLMHRLNKSYLTEAPESSLRQAKKFARYACEFAMIFKGFKNPFVGLNPDVFLKHYPELKKHEMLIGKLWNDKEVIEPADSYDFIVDAAHLLLSRYLKLVRSEIAIKNIEYGKDEPSIEVWFSFPSKEERNLFAKIYESTPDYRKIREAAFVGIETLK